MLKLIRLQLSHFRNYAHLALDCDAPALVFTGPNGAGKTNILEAVSLLVPGRGLRKSRFADLQQQGSEGGWAVASEVIREGQQMRLGTGQLAGQHEGEKRIVKLDGETLRAQSQLSEVMAILWQTPQMDQLFTEGGTARRQFFDRLTGSFDPAHAGHLARYERATRERNRLLFTGRMDDRWLSALERQMAEQSAAIAAARLGCMQALTASAGDLHPDFPRAHIALAGDAEDALAAGRSALQAEEALMAALAASREEDRATGRSSHGAHRLEFACTHPTGQEAALCSTGQQKILLLSLLLAQARASRVRTGVTPILLLDEVVAHLDETRRRALFEELGENGAQSWLTGTDAAPFAPLAAAHYHISDGEVRP